MNACFHLPSVVCENCAHLRSTSARPETRTFTTTRIIVAPDSGATKAATRPPVVKEPTLYTRQQVEAMLRAGDVHVADDEEREAMTDGLTEDDKKRLWLRLTRRVQALADLADLLAVDGHLGEGTEINQRLLDHGETLWTIADDLAALAQDLAQDLAGDAEKEKP